MDGAGDRFYLPDVQGYNWDAFGTLISRNGGNPTAYAWGGGSGYQTDADTGLKLLGHRYYDTRIGRFISQDPAGSGDNWYAYADNDPMDESDPDGLDPSQAQTPADVQWDLQDLYSNPNYNDDDDINYDSNGSPSFVDGNGKTWGASVLHSSGGGGDDSGGGLFDGAGAAAMVGVSAVGSAVSGGLWNGGAARHDPSFKTSLVLANIGVAAGTAAFGGEGALAKTACFTKGTPVQTEQGAKPIQDIHAGELVATRNLETNQTEYRKVVRTFQHLAHDTVTVEFADAKTSKVVDTLTATPEHPFYVVGHGMTALGKLGIGTLVVTRAGPSVVVHSLMRQHSAAGVAVYNLEVEGDHTYFVGNNGEWVHNDCTELLSPFELEFTNAARSKNYIRALMSSIREKGVKQAVQYIEHDGRKYIVDGNNRVKAARMLGLDKIPAQRNELPYGQFKTPEDLMSYDPLY